MFLRYFYGINSETEILAHYFLERVGNFNTLRG
nr:MAG TPA: hypothetical protein [Caudoviricetes sp.]